MGGSTKGGCSSRGHVGGPCSSGGSGSGSLSAQILLHINGTNCGLSSMLDSVFQQNLQRSSGPEWWFSVSSAAGGNCLCLLLDQFLSEH